MAAAVVVRDGPAPTAAAPGRGAGRARPGRGAAAAAAVAASRCAGSANPTGRRRRLLLAVEGRLDPTGDSDATTIVRAHSPLIDHYRCPICCSPRTTTQSQRVTEGAPWDRGRLRRRIAGRLARCSAAARDAGRAPPAAARHAWAPDLADRGGRGGRRRSTAAPSGSTGAPAPSAPPSRTARRRARRDAPPCRPGCSRSGRTDSLRPTDRVDATRRRRPDRRQRRRRRRAGPAATGGWTEWVPAEATADGAASRRPSPSTEVQSRLVLSRPARGAGPAVHERRPLRRRPRRVRRGRGRRAGARLPASSPPARAWSAAPPPTGT